MPHVSFWPEGDIANAVAGKTLKAAIE